MFGIQTNITWYLTIPIPIELEGVKNMINKKFRVSNFNCVYLTINLQTHLWMIHAFPLGKIFVCGCQVVYLPDSNLIPHRNHYFMSTYLRLYPMHFNQRKTKDNRRINNWKSLVINLWNQITVLMPGSVLSLSSWIILTF